MSRNYDNWERLVAAVIKRRQIWELCHQHSRTPSICSEASSSDFSSSFRSSDDFSLANSQESSHRPIPDSAFIQDSLIYRGGGGRHLWSSDVNLEKYEDSDDQKPIPKFVFVQGSLISRGRVGRGRLGPSFLVELRRGIRISDQDYIGDGTELVVKKLVSEVKVTEEEFKRVFGNCRHENVAAPRAYFFSDEAIYGNYVFYDYHRHGSLYDMLHADAYTYKKDVPDWETRLRIAMGAARGIAHIHRQNGGSMALGNVKSSNIFLNSRQYGCMSDFGLAALLKSPGAQVSEIYGAEEYERSYKIKNPSQESDVCSFGVVLLELVTGKSPMDPQTDYWFKNVNIVEWALSMSPQDWSSKLFDPSLWSSALSDRCKREIILDELYMLKFSRRLELENEIKEGMIEMLQVAKRCLVTLPQERPKMLEVMLLLENIPRLGDKISTHWVGR